VSAVLRRGVLRWPVLAGAGLWGGPSHFLACTALLTLSLGQTRLPTPLVSFNSSCCPAFIPRAGCLGCFPRPSACRRDSAELKKAMSDLETKNRTLAVNLQQREESYKQKLATIEVSCVCLCGGGGGLPAGLADAPSINPLPPRLSPHTAYPRPYSLHPLHPACAVLPALPPLPCRLT
jgi:hypothetical protein